MTYSTAHAIFSEFPLRRDRKLRAKPKSSAATRDFPLVSAEAVISPPRPSARRLHKNPAARSRWEIAAIIPSFSRQIIVLTCKKYKLSFNFSINLTYSRSVERKLGHATFCTYAKKCDANYPTSPIYRNTAE